MNRKSLQALFFDFDGVIVDSTQTKTEAFRQLFKEYDEQTVSRIIAYHRRHGGISRVEKIRYAYREIINEPLVDTQLTALARAYSDLVVDKVVNVAWIPGALEFLQEMTDRVPLFLISGTPVEELCEIVERRGISTLFREILGSPVKKPVHVQRLLQTYGLDADRCVFIGDALTDYDAARDTGLEFIGVRGEIAFPDGTIVLPDCSGLKEVLLARFHFD